MKRNVTLFCLVAVALLFATGCWNRRELNDISIQVGIAIDKVGKQYRVSTQIVDPGEVAVKQGRAGRAPVTMYHMTGDSVFETVRKMTRESPRKMYGAHLRMLVLGESVAREGIGKALDLISRDHEFRTDFYIVVARGASAHQILKNLTPLEKIPANKMFRSLETSENAWAETMSITLEELITDLTSEGISPVLTGIEITGDREMGETTKNLELIDSPVRVRYAGLAVFSQDKLVGWLNEEESKGLVYIRDFVDSTIENVTCPKGGLLGLEVLRSSTEVEGKVTNGKPEIDITIKTEGNVGEVQCLIDLTKSSTLADLEKRAEQEIKKRVERTIKKVQKTYKVDIFGFGQAIYQADPQAWKKRKGEWKEEFVDLTVNVNVDFKIRRLGTVTQSFLQDMKG
ncbi:Ger(x)C family spore germination protein [Brevibacillus humidisoli]|uniref:Ger(x)C family spore germination protein n=1 Tax=Brevibacillus humidisoli TaxID=2895522 RepID=UPI001E5105D7|nr:Ger(x)C family spore germination protein [Brevibacillus humidisoli]UFJ39836.1 Ger(x)C family spore germination protein [Brevibacillus humidisoli]